MTVLPFWWNISKASLSFNALIERDVEEKLNKWIWTNRHTLDSRLLFLSRLFRFLYDTLHLGDVLEFDMGEVRITFNSRAVNLFNFHKTVRCAHQILNSNVEASKNQFWDFHLQLLHFVKCNESSWGRKNSIDIPRVTQSLKIISIYSIWYFWLHCIWSSKLLFCYSVSVFSSWELHLDICLCCFVFVFVCTGSDATSCHLNWITAIHL